MIRLCQAIVLVCVAGVPFAAASGQRDARDARVQAARGKATYAVRCAACHGAAMQGGADEEMPPLIGERFKARWRDRPLGLCEKVALSMPQDDPGSLSASEASDIVAAIRDANHLPLSRTMTCSKQEANP